MNKLRNDSLDSKWQRLIFTVFALMLFCFFAFQLVFHAVRTSPTIDEPVHILAGYQHWQCKDFGINPEHPPMLKLLATLPLQFRELKSPPWECGSKLTSKPESFAFGNDFLVENGVDSVVIPSRIFASILSLLMAGVVFLAAWQMFGKWEALTALALVVFEPNFIAHGAVVTTDMALTLTALAFVFTLYRYGQNTNWKRFLAVGIAFGFLLAAKHSAVILLPIFLLLFIADAFFFASEKKTLLKIILSQTGKFALFFLIGLLILWAFYGFQPLSIPSANSETISVADYIKENGRPEMIQSTSAKIVNVISRTKIFPESYVYGLADIVATGSRNAVIFDKAYPTGQWFYFPIAFLVKSSIPLLLLLPIGFVATFFLREKRRELMFLLIPPIWFLGVAMSSGINLGVRHILPIYPFFFIIAAVGAITLYRKFSAFRYVLLLLLVYHAFTAYRTAPYNIAFANDFWGGVNNTHKVFADGNADWGQNLKFVNEYLTERNIKDCWFVGMGNTTLKGAMQPCHVMTDTFRWWFNNTIDEAVPTVIEGTVLVSSRDLPPRTSDEYVPIAKNEPIAQIGGGVFVYQGRFEIPLAAALSRVRRSAQFLGLKQIEEALNEAKQAVEIAPEDPRTHLALGLAMVKNGQKPEARQAFEKVLETSNKPIFRNEEVRAKQEIERLRDN